jgi:hypothetical protein
MDKEHSLSQLRQFRQELYQLLPARRDALLDLLDALCSSPQARSVVELSLSPLFRREYGSISDAIDHLFQARRPSRAQVERRVWDRQVARLIGRYLPAPQQRPFWLLGTDVVPVPRPFAPTLADKTYVYQPNPVAGNKPVTIGHAYSLVGCLPEKAQPGAPPWVVPLLVRRVQSTEKATVVGAEQLTTLLTDHRLPFHQDLSVHVADSAYSAVEFLGRVAPRPNLVSVTRTAENRVFYRPPEVGPGTAPPGHPQWYGERFALKDPTTWGPPDTTAETTFRTQQGHQYTVHLQGWSNLRMRGKRNLPMHPHPFTLIRAVVMNEHGQPVFKRALWLIVLGARRAELSLVAAWEVYGQRFDLEHYFRFGKQRLLLAAFQTPEVAHEENWVHLVQLAMVLLWLGRDLVEVQFHSWERYLPTPAAGAAAPSQVQRGWTRIIRQVGTPAKAPKRRGKAAGRATGTRLGRRPRQKVVKKAARPRRKAA